MTTDQLLKVVVDSLDNGKGRDVKIIDVQEKTSVADFMVVASATSERHAKSLADRVVEDAKQRNYKPMGVEGDETGDWVLVDLGDVILHVMMPQTRAYYQLEKLWETTFEAVGAGNS